MIGTIEIYAGFRLALEKKFPTILVQTKDIKNVVRPSFYIQYIAKNTNQSAQSYKTDVYAFNIVYFSKKEELLELLEIEEALESLFKVPLKVLDGETYVFLELGALNFTRNEDDYILNCGVDIEFTQYFENENRFGEEINTENMEDIEIT